MGRRRRLVNDACVAVAWLVLAAAALPTARAGCGYSLALPPGGGVDAAAAAASAMGFCSPYASDGSVGGAPASLCAVSVPAASVLQFGTCALPGAVCTGATNLTLVGGSGALLAAVGRVALNSSVAALSQGCVLGVRCSYGEWRNPALTATAVTVVESCHGRSACAGVVAWRVGADAAMLPALVPSTAAALAFTITAATSVTITQLAATLAAAGTPVRIWTRVGSAFAGGTLGAAAGWTQAYNGAWGSATSNVTLSPALSVAAGATATVLVSAPASTTLTCAHTLGDVASTLLSDATLTVRQGGALAATSGAFPFTWSNGATCALAGLALTYSTAAACPPAPPANVNVYNNGAHTMVDTLDDLLRALANPAVTDITVARHITLNGTALTISGSRTLQISGSNDCWPDLNTPQPCSLASDGTSRLLSVQNGVTLTISSMLLRDGVAPAGQAGGCLLINCATCSVSLAASVLSNCSAPSGPGGGIAVLGGGVLYMTNSTFSDNVASGGGGLLVRDSTATLSLVVFDSNSATGSITDTTVTLGGLPGPAGAGAALVNANATISDCRFASNIAATSDVALLANPAADQARGGGLFLAQSNVSVLRSTFADNAAFYGGGVYAHASTLSLATCAFVANVATLGDGGGAFALNSAVAVTDSLYSANSAGGHTGGGISAMNSTITLERSTLIGNTAPDGCGGALGMDVGASLTVMCNSVITGNSAYSGGGVCCNRCTAMTVDDTLLYGNEATHGSGGGAYISVSPSTFVNVTAWNNVAPAGGAVAAVSTWLNMTNCNLHDNAATMSHGGAVYHNSEDDMLDSLYMLDCVIANNTCMAGGGAVAAFSSASADFDSCDFTNNTITSAAPAGGAIMLLNVPSATVSDCTFFYNEIVLVPALEDGAPLGFVPGFDALMTAKGGAIWIGSDSPTLTTVTRGNFTHNKAPDGGAFYLAGAAQFVLQGSVFYHDHSWSEDDDEEHQYSGVGGGFGMADDVVAQISDAYFYSLESVRGGVGWHGGRAQATYINCIFDDNEAKKGDDTKGTAIYLRDAAQVVLRGCLVLNNEGHGIAEGTVTLGGTNMSRLHVEHTIFDGNWARLGSCLFITVPSQLQQLSLSNVTFRNSAAYVGAVMYTEAAEFGQLSCALPCYYDSVLYNNTARNYGSEIATPPKTINLELPATIRSGAPLPVNVTLLDGFGHTVADWPNTVGTVESGGTLGGPLRTFYQSGAADFTGLSLSGLQNTSYEISFTMTGQDLFGNDINTKSNSTNVTVLSCLAGERFDTPNLVCRCATGYGLVLADNTCRLCTPDEVVPPGSLSCQACPALSKPAPGSTEQCLCRAGFYGTIVGAIGACTECPADTYRSATDPPNKCLDCPTTSHTFALGATSVTDCLCAADFFNDRSGVNQTFSCAAVPEGGWAPQADSRLFALEGYWRPNANYSQLFSCSNGMCRKEFPADNGTTQLGYNCRDGHTGHLCAVCEQDWAYQGVYCSKCDNTQKYEAWTPAKRGGLIFIGIFLLLNGLFFLFYLPLFPRVEAWTSSMLQPAMDRMEKVLTNVANAARPASGVGSRPVSSSAAYRPRSAGHRAIASTLASVTKSLRQRVVMDAPPPPPPRDGRASARESTDSARRTSAFRRSSLRMGIAPSDSGAKHDSASVVHVRVQRPNRVQLFLDMVAEPARIVIGFWQIVSSFSSNLYVPWPSIYYSLANSLNVVSLQFLKLPAISCVQPAVSFFTIFNGVTIATAIYCIFCLSTYYLGARTSIAVRDVERRQRFKSRVITVFIWGLFLVYPQVASTTLLIFGCTELEDKTFWLMADYRIKCWTPQHNVYVGVGVLWSILFPLGIPAAFIYALYRAHIPELAVWKRDNAWLRSIVHRSLIIGVTTDFEFDPDTITCDSITLPHLRLLHKIFVANELLEEVEEQDDLGKPRRSVRLASFSLPPGSEGVASLPSTHVSAAALPAPGDDDAPANDSLAVVEHAPNVGRAYMTSESERASLSASKTKSIEVPQPSEGGSRLALLLRQVRMQVAVVSALKGATMRRTFSSLFWKTERDLLLLQLLSWAKHDKSTLVAEPRETQLRWRTEYEWRALTEQKAHLGSRDSTELIAFRKYRFLFASYAVHAWYWEAVDLFQKLFLTSLISFVVPHTATQVIVATMFSFGMVIFTIQVKPYREGSNNQLAVLSQVNIFLFLFTGLLLQTNPDGIGDNRLVFAVVVGMLTTSIVVFSFFLFLRELWRQLLNALFDLQDEQDDEQAGVAPDAIDPEGGSSDGGSVHEHWDDGSERNGACLLGDAPPYDGRGNGDGGGHPEGSGEMLDPEPEAHATNDGAGPSEATPPPPSWVSRLAAPREA